MYKGRGRKMEGLSGISEAVVKAGNQKALGEALGVNQQLVSRWESRGWVSVERAAEIEALYGVDRRRLIKPSLLDAVSGEVGL